MSIEQWGGVALIAIIVFLVARIVKQRNGVDPKGGGNGRNVEDK
jgi:hypothetical protein